VIGNGVSDKFDQIDVVSSESNSGVQTVRVAVLGNVDSGKSTLTSILSSTPNTLDDGRGSARTKVFNFKHEIENGRSTSLGHEIMGFDESGK
jgi:GTPase